MTSWRRPPCSMRSSRPASPARSAGLNRDRVDGRTTSQRPVATWWARFGDGVAAWIADDWLQPLSRADRLSLARRKKADHIPGGDRAAVEIALHLGAAQHLNLVQLSLGLDAFGRRRHVHATRQAGDRLHD